MSSESLVGKLLAGRFRVLELLAEGGMGEVYLAEHRVLKRPYAIKLMKSEQETDAVAAERFRREALAATRLDHPNIVHVVDFGRAANGRFYLAMEYVDGVGLDQLIEEIHPRVMPLTRALAILKQVASVTAAAHDAGVLHRDLKPANIMLTRGWMGVDLVKILDFGLAKIMVGTDLNVLTQRGLMFGTPEYMSPEQARGEELDSRTDIYSFGAVAFELLTGRPPFYSDNIGEVLLAKQTRDPVRPSETRPRGHEPLPERLDDVIVRCLARNRDARPLRISQVEGVLDLSLWEVEPPTIATVTTLKYERVSLEELADEEPVPDTRKPARSVGGAQDPEISLVEIDTWQWRRIFRAAWSVAELMRQHEQASDLVRQLTASLAEGRKRIRLLEKLLVEPVQKLEALETDNREQIGRLRYALIELRLEQSLGSENTAPDISGSAATDIAALSKTDSRLDELERKLARVYRTGQAQKKPLEQELKELEGRIESARQLQTNLEFELVNAVRESRPEQPTAEIAEAFEKLEVLLKDPNL